MKIVIDIPEERYKDIQRIASVQLENHHFKTVEQIITNGAPLPKGHGDLIDRNLALSDDGLCEFHRYDDYIKMRNYLKSISTIIEADKEMEG